MSRYLLLALNGPTQGEGDAEAYTKWYNEVHIPAIKKIEGIVSADRFKVLRGKMPTTDLWPFITMYEIETDDMAAVSAQLGKVMEMSTPTLDSSKSAHLFAIQIED